MRLFPILAILLLTCSDSFATWSVIIIDVETNEIGIAGASCTRNCYGIGKIIPGRGAIIVQAMSNSAARQKGLELILAGKSPDEIIKALMDPTFDPERQQYAVVTRSHVAEPATYTGTATHDHKGALTGNGFSVQGNTLTGQDVLQEIYDAVLRGKENHLSLHEILMMALKAGADAGGDNRCGEQKATSAFIIASTPGSRKPYLDLSIFGQKKGGPNAVHMLQNKYETWVNRRKE